MKFENIAKYLFSAISITVVSLIFLFNTFKTRADSDKETDSVKSHFEKRLDRIEDKLDRLIENNHKR